MDLSVIIVSWNVKDKLRRNLTALQGSVGDFSREIFVVDNNSADGSADMLRQEFPEVNLIANQENLGFSKANNQALKQASGDYILLLNPDMLVENDTLQKILSWAQHHQSATVSTCRLVDEQGQTIRQVRRFPGFWDQLAVTLKLPHFWPSIINHYLCADFDYDQAAQVDSIRGAFFLINRSNYQRISQGQEPFLNEDYFIWFEEVDFCRQVKAWGGEVWYAPVATCRDYVGASFAQVPFGQAQKYFSASMLKYFEKWGKKWEYRVLTLAWRLVYLFI